MSAGRPYGAGEAAEAARKKAEEEAARKKSEEAAKQAAKPPSPPKTETIDVGGKESEGGGVPWIIQRLDE